MRIKVRSVILLIGILSSFHSLAQEMPPAQVNVVALKSKTLAPKIELKGNVVSLRNSTISAQVEGELLDISMVGTRVEKAHSLASIDAELFELALQRAQARLAAHEADLVFKNSEVTRFSSLAKSDNASKTQLQQSISARNILNQQIIIAKADIKQAKKALQNTQVKAPFGGVVQSKHAQTGEYISVGEPLLQLVDIENIEVSVPVPLSVYPFLKKGDLVQVSAQGKRHILPVRTLILVGDQQNRMVEVRLDASGSDLLVGESVSVYAPRAKPDTKLAVPRDAIVIRGSQTFIYRANAGIAEQIAVDILFSDDVNVAIVSKQKGVTVREGDSIIVKGAERLQAGSPISVE